MSDFVSNNVSNSKCTICDILVNDVYEHPILKVSICKTCFYSVKSVDKDNDGCVWCGHGTEMLYCVQCPCKFCIDCVTRNLGSEYINVVNEKNWSCFVCESDAIKEQQNEYLRMLSYDINTATNPEASGTTIDISSPIIIVDDSDDNGKKEENITNQYQDLDFILSVYEKQIKSSLEFDDANIPAIIKEINSIKTDQLNIAIYSYKKCLNAFMSDLTNLEARVIQAEAFNNPATSIKLTSLLRILVQHHIFNRICHPQARIKDDHVSWLIDRKPCNPIKKIVPTTSTPNPVLMVIDSTKRKNVIVKPQTFERKDKEVNEMVSKIKDLCSRQRSQNESDDEDFEPSGYNKRRKLSESEEKFNRRARSLITPSWLTDYKVEKENDILESNIEEIMEDREWTDPRMKRVPGTGKRGRPPKYHSFSERTEELEESMLTEDSGLKKGRGRPKKTVFINVKEPRYYIQKKNGENLASSSSVS